MMIHIPLLYLTLLVLYDDTARIYYCAPHTTLLLIRYLFILFPLTYYCCAYLLLLLFFTLRFCAFYFTTLLCLCWSLIVIILLLIPSFMRCAFALFPVRFLLRCAAHYNAAPYLRHALRCCCALPFIFVVGLRLWIDMLRFFARHGAAAFLPRCAHFTLRGTVVGDFTRRFKNSCGFGWLP